MGSLDKQGGQRVVEVWCVLSTRRWLHMTAELHGSAARLLVIDKGFKLVELIGARFLRSANYSPFVRQSICLFALSGSMQIQQGCAAGCIEGNPLLGFVLPYPSFAFVHLELHIYLVDLVVPVGSAVWLRWLPPANRFALS